MNLDQLLAAAKAPPGAAPAAPAAKPAGGGSTGLDRLLSQAGGAPAPAAPQQTGPQMPTPNIVGPKEFEKYLSPENVGATKNPFVSAITGGSTLGKFLGDTMSAIPDKTRQVFDKSADFWSNQKFFQDFAKQTDPKNANTALGFTANTGEAILNHLSAYGTSFLSGITGGMMQAPDSTRTNVPKAPYTPEDIFNNPSLLQSPEYQKFLNDDKAYAQSPDALLTNGVGVLGQGVGMFETLGGLTKLLAPIATPKAVIGFLNQYPKVAQYAIPLLQDAAGFATYSQLDPKLGTNLGERLKAAGVALATAPVYSAFGMLKNPALSLPASFGLGFGMAKFSGASNEDATAAGISFLLLDAAGRSANGKEAFVDGRRTDDALTAEAFNTLNHIAGTNVNSRSSAAEVKSAYLKAAMKAHPDKGGSHPEFVAVQSAYEYLSGKANNFKGQPPETATHAHNVAEAAGQLAAGKSEAEITYGLATKTSSEEAGKVVTEAKEHVPEIQAKAGEVRKPIEQATEKTTENKPTIEKTPADIQKEITDERTAFENSTAALEQQVKDKGAELAAAKPQSQEKKDLKQNVLDIKNQIKEAKAAHFERVTAHAKQFATDIAHHVNTELKTPLDEKGVKNVIARVVEHVTNPELVGQHANISLHDITARVHEEVLAEARKEATGIPQHMTHIATAAQNAKSPAEFERGLNLADKRAITISKFKTPGEFYKAANATREEIESKMRSQKQIVKEAVEKKGEAHIKEVAKETGILEPNIRRILGMGAKDGTFERVGDGVYKIKTPDGKEIAYVIPGDALEELPRLAKEGFKADMVFLDIPYDAAGNKGGNRMNEKKGTLFKTITPDQFAEKIVESLKQIARDENSPVVYMFSQSKSSEKTMAPYTQKLIDAGYKPIAKGDYFKMSKKGTRLTKPMRPEPLDPEGIILFNQSGKFDFKGETPPNLQFKLVRPVGYQTEKPQELLRQLIEMTTEEGDVVFDPFAGSGVTGEQAVKTGRRSVSIEKDEEQAKRITERIQNAVPEKLNLHDVNHTLYENFDANGERARVASVEGGYVLQTRDATISDRKRNKVMVFKTSEAAQTWAKKHNYDISGENYGRNDVVKITSRETGESQERTVKGPLPDDEGYIVVGESSGIPYKATFDKWNFELVKAGDHEAPLPKKGVTFGELAKAEAEEENHMRELAAEGSDESVKVIADHYWREKIAPYIKDGDTVVIDPDEIRKFYNDYEEGSRPAYSKAAQRVLDRALKEHPGKNFGLVGGGSGSGKSEFLTKDLVAEKYDGVIYDATQSNPDFVMSLIEKAKGYGKEPEAYFVISDPEEARFWTLVREAETGRPVFHDFFVKVHSAYPKTILKLAENGVDVHGIDTRGKSGEQIRDELANGEYGNAVEIIKNLDYTEETVRAKAKSAEEYYGNSHLNKSGKDGQGARKTGLGTPEATSEQGARTHLEGKENASGSQGQELELASRLTFGNIKARAEAKLTNPKYRLSEGNFEHDGQTYKYKVEGADVPTGEAKYTNDLLELAKITRTSAADTPLSKADVVSLYKSTPKFRDNPYLTVEVRELPVPGNKFQTENAKVLTYKDRTTDFSVRASALGLKEENLNAGDRIKVDPANFKNAESEIRVIRKNGDKEEIHASMMPESEKVPRNKKPGAEIKEISMDEIFAMNKELAKNLTAGNYDPAKHNKDEKTGVARALNEIATLFNPVGQTPSKATDVLMSKKGEYEKNLFRTEQNFKAVKKMWDKQSEEARLDFMDKVETGRVNEIPEELIPLAQMYKRRLDNAYIAIKEFKDINFLKQFFPHFWEDAGKLSDVNAEAKEKELQNFYARQNAKRPLEGNKSFTKERVFATIKEGIEAGYTPVTTNPEELMQLYEQNVGKFLMANRIMKELKITGFSKFVKIGGEVPDGFAKVNDAIARVYLNPNIKVTEYYDEQVYDKLHAVLDRLGIEHERATRIGMPGALGFTQRGTDKITTKFGSPLSVIAHELGHQLDYRYNLQEVFKADPDRTYEGETDYSKKELRALADLRIEGHDVTDSHKAYIRKGAEKMAVMLEAYVHTPQRFKEVAPRTFEKFTTFLSMHSELRPILDIKPSLVLGQRDDTIHAGGAVISGEYWLQKDVARLLNNYLSRDYLTTTAIGRGVMNAKNTLNAFELGLSAFHFTMETLDTVTTKFSIGLTKILHGDMTGFGDALIAPLAPATYFRSGQKFYNGDPELLKIENDLFTGGASLRSRQYYQNTVLDDFLKSAREIQGMLEKGNVVGAASKVPGELLRVPLSAIEMTMRPLFSYYIPRLKVGAFRDLFASELERNSQKIQDGVLTREQVARDVWNNIENRMGELNYDNLFWNRNLKASLMVMTRAVGWNLGTIRELGGGAFQDLPKSFGATSEDRENFKKYGFDFTPKMAYTLSLFFVVATISSIYQYLHTGQKPTGLKDLFYPRNGATDKSGEPYRVEFPTYLKDIYQSGIPQLLQGDVFGAADSAVKMAKNKSAPEWSAMFEVLNNRDFYGDMIRNPHDNSPTQLKQLGLFLMSQLTPFTFQQQQNLAKGKSTPEQQAEAFFGIIKAPKDVIQSDYQKIIQNLYADQRGGFAPRTPEQVAQDDAKASVIDQIKHGDYSGIPDLLKQGILKPGGVAQFIQNALLTTPQKQYKYLTPENKNKLQQKLAP